MACLHSGACQHRLLLAGRLVLSQAQRGAPVLAEARCSLCLLWGVFLVSSHKERAFLHAGQVAVAVHGSRG